jgi:hypothetical protein
MTPTHRWLYSLRSGICGSTSARTSSRFLDDGAPEPAPNLAVLSYVFCILNRAHVSPDLLLIASAYRIDVVVLPVDDH